MAATDDLYDELWKEMFNADFARDYYRELAAEQITWQKRIQICQALLSSSAIASWGIWSQLPLIWSGLLAMNTAVAVIHPFLKLAEQSKDATEKHVLYTGLYYDWKRVFFDLRDGKEIDKIRADRDKNYVTQRDIETKELGAQNRRIADKVYKELYEEYKGWTRQTN